MKSQGIIVTWNAVAIGELASISNDSLATNAPAIDISSFADTLAQSRPGNVDVGDFTFTYNYNPDDTSQASLETDYLAGTERVVTLTCPAGTINTITFDAICINVSFNAANSDSIHIGTAVLCIKNARPEKSEV